MRIDSQQKAELDQTNYCKSERKMKIEREHAESKETMAIGVAVDNKETVKAHWVE